MSSICFQMAQEEKYTKRIKAKKQKANNCWVSTKKKCNPTSTLCQNIKKKLFREIQLYNYTIISTAKTNFSVRTKGS